MKFYRQTDIPRIRRNWWLWGTNWKYCYFDGKRSFHILTCRLSEPFQKYGCETRWCIRKERLILLIMQFFTKAWCIIVGWNFLWFSKLFSNTSQFIFMTRPSDWPKMRTQNEGTTYETPKKIPDTKHQKWEHLDVRNTQKKIHTTAHTTTNYKKRFEILKIQYNR